MHIQGFIVLGNLSVLGLVAIFLISAFWVLIEVCFRASSCQAFLLALLSPGPVTHKCSCHVLERLCCSCSHCLSLTLLVTCSPLLPSVLHSSAREDLTRWASYLFTEGLLMALLALGPAPIPCPISCGQPDGMV